MKPKLGRLTPAKDTILSHFASTSPKVYSEDELAGVLFQNRTPWDLASRTTVADFIAFLHKQGGLQVRHFRSTAYNHRITRYSWGNVSPLELAISIKPRAYLCHGTAMALHGLTSRNPKTIYLNVEQSPKVPSNSSLTQDGINRAFAAQQRQSNLIYKCNGVSVTIISGKNMNGMGVVEIAGPSSESIRVTNLERTLVDIVARPAYAGGVSRVLETYHHARDRMSIDRLLATLKMLHHVYPYHQSIGFLLQKAGYPARIYERLRALPLNYDFYLAHGMQQPEYSAEWRLFHPRRLKTYPALNPNSG